jgi:prolipoprotein diacylglyceryltransferase
MNSEIIGLPYDGPGAFAFIEETRRAITSHENNKEEKYIIDVEVKKNDSKKNINGLTYPGVTVSLIFNPKMSQEEVYNYLSNYQNLLAPKYKSAHKHFLKPTENYVVAGNTATVNTFMVTRHPAQLYESISSFVLFIILLLVYLKLRKNTPEGLLSGMFLIWIFTLRFFYEFIKENQVIKEADMNLNIGQLLSIPMVLFGVFLIYHSFKKKKKSAE